MKPIEKPMTRPTVSIAGNLQVPIAVGHKGIQWKLGRGVAGLSLFITLIACGGSSTATVPKITNQPSSILVSTGATGTLTVVATGSSLSYQWYKDGSTVAGGTSSAYSIPIASSADEGTYFVVVSNSIGSVTSSDATVTVSGTSGDGDITVK